MSFRFIVFLAICLNFILFLVAVYYIPPYPNVLNLGIINLGVSSFVLVLLGYWVWIDGRGMSRSEQIMITEKLYDRVVILEEKLKNLENK